MGLNRCESREAAPSYMDLLSESPKVLNVPICPIWSLGDLATIPWRRWSI
jgi:hypothetical protein